MSRILFLDDNPHRRRWAARELGIGRSLAVSEDAGGAIGHLREAVTSGKSFDLAFLDHDLGGETFADSSREDTGYEVVRWIVANRPVIGHVVVHSLNAPAANRMVDDLRRGGQAADCWSFLTLVQLAKSGELAGLLAKVAGVDERGGGS